VGATEKISISIGRQELRGAKVLASRLHVSLSTLVTDAVRLRIEEQARSEAAKAVLASFAPGDRATPEEQKALLARWSKKRSPKRARKK
jgi:predicted transcriptional regulator